MRVVDLEVEIQFCNREGAGLDEEGGAKYRGCFQKIKELVSSKLKEADKISIIQKHAPLHYKNVISQNNQQKQSPIRKQNIKYPRQESFQIYADKILIFSRLRSHIWPDTEKIATLIYRIYEQKRNGREVSEYAYEYWNDLAMKIDDKAYQEFVESISNTSDRNIRTLIRQIQELRYMNGRYIDEYQSFYLDYKFIMQRQRMKYSILLEENQIAETALRMSKKKVKEMLINPQGKDTKIEALVYQNEEKEFKISILESSLKSANQEISSLKTIIETEKQSRQNNPQFEQVDSRKKFTNESTISRENIWVATLSQCEQKIQKLSQLYAFDRDKLRRVVQSYHTQNNELKGRLEYQQMELKRIKMI